MFEKQQSRGFGWLLLAGIGLVIQLVFMPARLDLIGLFLLGLGLALYNRRDDSLLHQWLAPLGFVPHWLSVVLTLLGVTLVLVIPAWHLESIGTLLVIFGIGIWGNKRPQRPDVV